jgi:hypothetical protein
MTLVNLPYWYFLKKNTNPEISRYTTEKIAIHTNATLIAGKL